MMFQCSRVGQIWDALGLRQAVDETLMADRSGRVVLEHLLCSKAPVIPLLDGVPVQEVVAVSVWYI
jgi:hypothetical protein